MPVEIVAQTWTIGSWCVDGVDADSVASVLAGVDTDAFALQSIRKDDIERIADRLAVRHVWELSNHPISPVLAGFGRGLAVLTRHSIRDSASVVTNNHSSVWSRRRRIAHFAVVERADRSGYTIGHAADSPDPDTMGGSSPAPLVWLRPAQIGVDLERAIAVPAAATVTNVAVHEPVVGKQPLMTVTFAMNWPHGELAGA